MSPWAEQSKPLNHLFWFCPVSKSMSCPTIILDLWLILQITLVWQARTGFSGVENTLQPDSAVDIILHQVVCFSNWQKNPQKTLERLGRYGLRHQQCPKFFQRACFCYVLLICGSICRSQMVVVFLHCHRVQYLPREAVRAGCSHHPTMLSDCHAQA